MKRRIALLLSLLLALWAAAACAQEARDITAQCSPTSPGRYTTNLYDRAYTSYWNSREQRNPYVEFTAPQDAQARYLYICFGDMPRSWAIEEEVNGAWQTLIEGTNDYHHVFLDLGGGKTRFRLIDTSGRNTKLKINEIFIFTEGEIPDWVQRWAPTPQKAYSPRKPTPQRTERSRARMPHPTRRTRKRSPSTASPSQGSYSPCSSHRWGSS